MKQGSGEHNQNCTSSKQQNSLQSSISVSHSVADLSVLKADIYSAPSECRVYFGIFQWRIYDFLLSSCHTHIPLSLPQIYIYIYIPVTALQNVLFKREDLLSTELSMLLESNLYTTPGELNKSFFFSLQYIFLLITQRLREQCHKMTNFLLFTLLANLFQVSKHKL